VQTGGDLYSDINGVRPELPIQVDRAARTVAIVGHCKIRLAVSRGFNGAAKLSIRATESSSASEH
jgi:hypothetical protein